MATINIGYRRLFDSIGCSITTQEPLHITFPLGDDLQVEIYMGNKPKLGIWIETGHEDYAILGTAIVMGSYEYQSDATQSAYPRTFFTEIICTQIEEIPDDLFDAFYHENPEAAQELVRRAEAHAQEYTTALDLVTGIIGLRFHPQFVMKLLNNGPVAFHNEKRVVNNAGSPIQMLESIALTEAGIHSISQLFPAIGKIAVEEVERESRILEWLARAWAEREIISKFNALFIPLEMILEGVEGELPEDQRQQVETLSSLIATCDKETEEKEALKMLLDRLVKNQRPSLRDRFTLFAKHANLPGYENDIKVFKKFNGIRNGLLHRGDSNVRIHVTIGEADVHALEDLAER
ncbi:MAG TPA: hypothetical protein VN207_03765, partial [Ktedonobacteraceae bacterium]|nr:hypothetical protein [Ktedonobacteraceae bacterium]